MNKTPPLPPLVELEFSKSYASLIVAGLLFL
jgi:hypothetical protein